MTQEFKEALLQYLIGELPEETGNNEQIIKSIQEIERSEWNGFLPNSGSWTAMRIEGIITPRKETNDLTIMFGGYSTGAVQDSAYGFIYLLDNNFKPVKLFEEYSNGTKLRYIQRLEVDSDGNYYGVDDNIYSYDNAEHLISSEKRFIMLNNFSFQTNGSYILTQRKSYIFPENCTNFYCKYISKNNSSSHYFLAGARSNYIGSSWDFDAIAIIDLKINVGSENEWSLQSSPLNTSEEGVVFGGAISQFDSDDKLSFNLLGTGSSNQLKQPIYLYQQNFDETEWTRTQITSKGLYIDSINFNNQCYFISFDVAYFVLTNETWGNTGIVEEKYIGLYRYTISSNQLDELYLEYLGDHDYVYTRGIYLSESNNEIYILYCTDDNEDEIGNFYYFRYIDKWSPILILENKPFRYRSELFFSRTDFNLVSSFLTKTTFTESYWNQVLLKENYNALNYNGQPYLNTNALIPNSAELYSNNSLVFARNLYNKTTNDNITVSTVEVPFNYVNDININNKNLLSETNLLMVQDQNIIQKNIYESLLINFVNTFLVADKNNGNNVLNQPASNYINTSINDETAYTNAKFYDKIKITYQDNSTKEIAYEYQNLNGSQVTIAFGLYVDKLMRSAEILSNDQTITYQTIDLMSLEQGNYYTIKQDLEVL